MKKLLLIVVVGMLTACGSDAGKEVQTYQTLIDAAQSDAVKLSNEINSGVDIKINTAEFTRSGFGDGIQLLKLDPKNSVNKPLGMTINILKSEESKMSGKTEFVLNCTNNKVEAGIGAVVILADCTIK